ncbi:exo-rhamnogalacturonan lyase family protein [Rhodohalobacter halophilus]|uniref:exo-rhamnogalacturonan lyase family protein n=1 Tax=Rhodohalobacter halophilus TaxID=1812810 RepID=UPI000A9DBF04|nr:hypothetical protein [Rhodohalobacter halophilus]
MMKKLLSFLLLIACIQLSLPTVYAQSGSEVTVQVQRSAEGAPVKFGLPFQKGELKSPDHVRVLNSGGDEIAIQTTEVTSWQPADDSVKWLWVFFFADGSEEYVVQYGENVRQSVFTDSPIMFKNNQRVNGFAEIETGPLKIRVDKGGSGFLDRVYFNPDQDGYDEEHIVASGLAERGSFLDLMDDAGIDTSHAVIHQHFIEKGSGPMHAILRVEGEYEYNREDHENSPFVTYIHTYAGKAYVKVLHTITYTGKPDQSEPLNGRQHEDIGTQTELLIDEEERSKDEGLTRPKDRIASAGFGLKYHLDRQQNARTALETGKWWEDGEPDYFEQRLTGRNAVSVFQTGPQAARETPMTVSDKDQRVEGFVAEIRGDRTLREGEKSEGWLSVSDSNRGITIALKNMVEEYPNELSANSANGTLHAYTWSPNEEPMSFARFNTNPDGGMVGNFAQGLTKTTEVILNFHEGGKSAESVRDEVISLLNPPVAHAGAEWYSRSGVYGNFAGTGTQFDELERSLQYKYEWMLFNQKWEPWYGMFDYGDMRNYYFNNTWVQWANNEPAMDFQYWMQFMRTGDVDFYEMAKAMSRHTMDVDNTHWPRANRYRGDTNRSLDWFDSEMQPEIDPYVGMGRRHAGQQWISMLSAHVWVPGWIASYYLDGYHRGLDVARLTGDYYVRREFGGHGVTGRRLYLSIWNLAELYDATKDEIYLSELDDRLERMLSLQRQQGGRIVIDRYGYSQNYISHGLSKVLQMFERPDLERALVDNARSLYNNPPYDHDMESYLSSIHPLIVGYDLTGEEKYIREACYRSRYLPVDEMPNAVLSYDNQGELAEALESVSRLPSAGEGPSFRGRLPIWTYSNGLRIFGWTHAFNVPYTIERLQHLQDLSGLQCVD